MGVSVLGLVEHSYILPGLQEEDRAFRKEQHHNRRNTASIYSAQSRSSPGLRGGDAGKIENFKGTWLDALAT